MKTRGAIFGQPVYPCDRPIPNRIMCYVLSDYYYQLLIDGYEVERVSGQIAYMVKEVR
jgi:hypothetical protein